MYLQAIVDALKATTNADSQEKATEYLKEASKMVGFSQILLNITISEEADCAVRQAAVIYLKNTIRKSWEVNEQEKDVLPLCEQDKVLFKQKLLPAILHSPEPIRIHLSCCAQYIMRADFPDKWIDLKRDLYNLLHSSCASEIQASMLIIHRLCKIYEYKQEKERFPLYEAMKEFLPLLYQLFEISVREVSEEACLFQKHILKIFFCLVQFTYNINLIKPDDYGDWLKLFCIILERNAPELTQYDSPEESAFWKCKKWSIKIIGRVFDRYGSKGQVEDIYAFFAEHYLKEYAAVVVNCVLQNIFEDYAQKKFVSSRVIYLSISHVTDAISHAKIWLIIKPHFENILQNIIFPLLAHTKEDEEMWDEDIEDYLRLNYDAFEELHNPAMAATEFIRSAVRRAGVLAKVLEFALSRVTSSTSSFYELDAGLHAISALSRALMKSKKYKKEVEKLVHAVVIPNMAHSDRFVRLRACYTAKFYSSAYFGNPKIIAQLVGTLVQRLIDSNEEIPVKVEAATSIASLLNDQEKAISLIKPHVREVLMEVLRLISRIQIDELPGVVDALIENFEEDVIPVAYDVVVELIHIFNRLVGIEENDVPVEDYAVTVMGILATVERIVCLIEEKEEILARIEPIVRSCVVSIFKNFCSTYFEEALMLTQTLISAKISPEMWEVFDMIYDSLLQEGTIFFIDCMPALHLFLTVDTAAFLEVPQRAQRLLEMCEKTLNDEEGDEDLHMHVAKLFEVFLIQCNGHVDSYVLNVLQLTLNRLKKPCEKDLFVQLLVVFISAFYCNSDLFLESICHLNPPVTFDWLVNEILANADNIDGVHNRKMALYLMCKVLSVPPQLIPKEVQDNPKIITEFCIMQFDGLQKCLKALAENRSDGDSDSSSSDDEDRMNSELKDSDDDVDEGTLEYLEAIRRSKTKKSDTNVEASGDTENFDEFLSDSNDSEEYHEFVEETQVESFETLLDVEDKGNFLNVFLLFKDTLRCIEEANPALFQALVSNLDENKAIELQKLMTICTQQENLEHSKQVAQKGGYTFNASAPVPSNFKFS